MPSLGEYPDGLSLSHQNWRLGDGDRRGAAGRMSAAQGWRAQGLNHSCRPGLPRVITPILTSLGSGGLPGEKGSMTPFPGRAGAAAHPKVKRRPPFSVPAAVPDHDYGAVGREITPARPRRWLRGSATSPVPGHRDAAPLPAAAPPLSAGPIPRSSARPTTFSRPRPCGRRWWICASAGRAWRCAFTWTLRPPTGPSRGAAGPAVLAESADAAGPASGERRRRRGAPRA